MKKFMGKYRIDSARLKEYDYDSPGWYFVTICTKNRIPYFGTIDGKFVSLNEMGAVAANCWRMIPTLYPFVSISNFSIMPNHLHGLIGIAVTDDGQNVFRRRDVAMQCLYQGKFVHHSNISPASGSLPAIIRSYKSACTKIIRKRFQPNFSWQSRYYDTVIRDEVHLWNVRQYLLHNPQNAFKNPVFQGD